MSQGVKRGNEDYVDGGGKKMRGDTVTLRFLLMSKHAGGIIGKGGQTIKRLRSEYSATVTVPDSNTPERVLSIAASQENVIQVLIECLPLFHEPPYPVKPGGGGEGPTNTFEIDFLVHSSQVGGIIGRGGLKIKELRETTCASIKVFQECLPNSTERVVAIGGGEEEIVSCLRSILELMQEQPIKGNIALYDPSQEQYNQGYGDYGPPMGGGGMRGGRGGIRGGGRGSGNRGNLGGRGGGYGGRGGGNFGGSMGGQNNPGYGGGFGGNDFSGNQGFDNYGGGNFNAQGGPALDSQTTQVTIPNDLAGAIIGKGGERIRNIRQKSGADIKIEDSQPGKTDRVITITGTADQVQYGQFLMQQSVRQHSGNKL